MPEHGYVPILLTKRGERIAMRDTVASVKDRMEPLWVVAPPAEGKTIDHAVANVASDLSTDWGPRLAFVDTQYLGDETTAAGAHTLTHVVTAARTAGVPLIPVTGPDRTPAHHAVTAALAAMPGALAGRVCLRLTFADALQLTLPPASRIWDMPALLATLGVVPAGVDVVLDFGEQVGHPGPAATIAHAIVGALASSGAWRSVTLAATSIPASLAGYAQMALTALPRLEWQAYTHLAGLGPAVAVRYGDYAVQHPDLPLGVDGRFLRIFSQIRYSTDREWLIARGQELKVHGYGHVSALAGLITGHPDYSGPSFSTGDRWLDSCATGSAASNGSPEVWRRVGTNHHLARVAHQVAGFHGVPAP